MPTLALLAAASTLFLPPWPADFERIDAHVHIFRSDPAYYRMLEQLNLRVVNICVLDKHSPGFEQLEPQLRMAPRVFAESHGRTPWVSSFDPAGFESPDFARQAEQVLDSAFSNGAIGVKIFKSIGMEIRSRSGDYLMADNPALAPVFKHIAARGRTVYAHLAEPGVAWRPLDPAAPHYGYYQANPSWHMYLHPEKPSKETILAARDHMLELNPGLRVIGCHLGSLEEDVRDLAKTLDRYPNLAVDTAGRVVDLMNQPRESVRDFLVRYQDRVLYATDLAFIPTQDAAKTLAAMRTTYARDWKYFATNEMLDFHGSRIQGLALPPEVLKKLYRENALRWLPGILP